MTRQLKILVVDDDIDNAQSLGELFELEGHAAKVVHTGEDAVKAFMAEDFDVAFMDVMMPGKNGVESFLEIKRLKPDAHVYMMTGYSVEQLLQQAIDGGAKGVFGKPVDIERVIASLAKVDEPGGVVLVAEDDPDFGPMLRQMIAQAGYKSELVTNGADALARVMTGKVEVLILDLKMPLMSGIEVYATLKEYGKLVPTIIITANAAEYGESLTALDDIAATGILNKPFDPGQLLDRLHELAA
ncbi:MAG: response regulator [Rhizobiales bacterium]|nr:response regulator [Hyphomicrobiales bacterium]